MYNKLFTKILDSSIWLAPDPHRIVWITFLAAMDEDGNVMFASAANVAARARVSREAAQEAITAFENPDPDSGDPDNEGRRIERIVGGWHVLNAAKYRQLVTKAISREHTRLRTAKWRANKAGDAAVTQAAVTTPSQPPVCDAPVTQSEAEAESEARSGSLRSPSARAEIVPRETLSAGFEQFLESTYPATSHGRNTVVASKRAQGLIGSGKATEQQLRARLTGFRAFVDSGGYSDPSKVPAMQRWFEPHAENPYWARDWAPIPTKAQQQQDANVSAGLAFLNRNRSHA